LFWCPSLRVVLILNSKLLSKEFVFFSGLPFSRPFKYSNHRPYVPATPNTIIPSFLNHNKNCSAKNFPYLIPLLVNGVGSSRLVAKFLRCSLNGLGSKPPFFIYRKLRQQSLFLFVPLPLRLSSFQSHFISRTFSIWSTPRNLFCVFPACMEDQYFYYMCRLPAPASFFPSVFFFPILIVSSSSLRHKIFERNSLIFTSPPITKADLVSPCFLTQDLQ